MLSKFRANLNTFAMRLRKRCAPFFINHGYTIVETQEIEFVISHFFILLSIFLYYVFSIYSLWEANGTVLTLFINFFAVAKVNLSLYIHLKKRLNYMLGLPLSSPLHQSNESFASAVKYSNFLSNTTHFYTMNSAIFCLTFIALLLTTFFPSQLSFLINLSFAIKLVSSGALFFLFAYDATLCLIDSLNVKPSIDCM